MVFQTSIRTFFKPTTRTGCADVATPTTCTAAQAAGTKRAQLQEASGHRTPSCKAKPGFQQVRRALNLDLGEGSEIVYYPLFLDPVEADGWLTTLDKQLPWSRARFFIHGRDCLQPRQSVYVADRDLPTIKYDGHEPNVHFWDEFPVLGKILDAVRRALPDTNINSVLLNRYADGQDYVSWHSDDTKVYGPRPTIVSITLGAEREFLVRRKKQIEMVSSRPTRQIVTGAEDLDTLEGLSEREDNKPGDPGGGGAGASDVAHSGRQAKLESRKTGKCSHRVNHGEFTSLGLPPTAYNQGLRDRYSFLLKHGSMLVMKGNMQRDWQHSVPKRIKAGGVRINLTFRSVVSAQQGRYLGQSRR